MIPRGFLICHFGGWEGRWHNLPYADLYICTGGILPSTPFVEESTKDIFKRKFFPTREAYIQARYVRNHRVRSIFKNKEAPVIVCRGPRDYVSLSKLFEGGPVYEIEKDSNEVIDINGVRVAGIRGTISVDENVNDGKSLADFNKSLHRLPLLIDVLASAQAPKGKFDSNFYDKIGNGSAALSLYLDNQLRRHGTEHLKLHCFTFHQGSPGCTASSDSTRSVSVVVANTLRGYRVFRWNGKEFNQIHVHVSPEALPQSSIRKEG